MAEPFSSFGKMLIVIGIVIIVVGLILLFANKIPFIGRLPGDISVRRGNFTFYFPIVSSVLLSLILTLIFYFINKMRQ